VAAARSDTVGVISLAISYKFRAVAVLNSACVGTGDIFFRLASAWNSGMRTLTMVIMVTTRGPGTIVRVWSSLEHIAWAILNCASAYIGGRVGGFFGHCGVGINIDADIHHSLS
jgi:hypothetical protein